MSLRKITFLYLTVFLVLTSGCAKKEPADKVIAIINDYRMTVEDYEYESKEALRIGRLLGKMPIAKEDILDALITKELLLQEAQRLGLDKDKNFMKTIELYWEQTLIRNLMAKKTYEIEKAVVVDDSEVEEYYGKMKQRVKAEVIVCGDERLGRKLLRFEGNVARYAMMKPEQFSLKYVIPSRYYTLGDDASELEYKICNIAPRLRRAFVQIDGDWALVIVEERIPAKTLPLTEVKDDIIKNIRDRKEKEMVDRWLKSLRQKARIRVFKDVFNEVHQ